MSSSANGSIEAVFDQRLRVLAAIENMEKPVIAEERRAVMRTMGTEDQKEGMRAFLEKRKPRFTGK